MVNCLFCKGVRPVFENELAFAIFDKHPVTRGHLLVIPKRHAVDYFALTFEEKMAIDQLLDVAKKELDNRYQPDGYNIGNSSRADYFPLSYSPYSQISG